MGVTPIIRTGCHSAEGARWWCLDELYTELGCEFNVPLRDIAAMATKQEEGVL